MRTLSAIFILLLSLFSLLVSCKKEKEYETVAKEFMEAKYRGDLTKAQQLAVPEASEIFNFMKVIYEQNPTLKTINEDASCYIVNSELSSNNQKATVTIEENNIYAGNLLNRTSTQKTKIETQETVLNLEKRGEKWFVVINQ